MKGCGEMAGFNTGSRWLVMAVLGVVLTSCAEVESEQSFPIPSRSVSTESRDLEYCTLYRQQYQDLVWSMSPDGTRIRPKDTSQQGLDHLRVVHDQIVQYCRRFP